MFVSRISGNIQNEYAIDPLSTLLYLLPMNRLAIQSQGPVHADKKLAIRMVQNSYSLYVDQALGSGEETKKALYSMLIGPIHKLVSQSQLTRAGFTRMQIRVNSKSQNP